VIRLLRKFAITKVLKSRWRNHPQSLARTLGKFADVEADSSWHYTIAADLMEAPEHRAAMLLTALEETHHAYLFNRLKPRGGGADTVPISRKHMLGSAADLPDFLAYSQVAEGHINREFSLIAKASADEDVKAVIRSISSDEGAHEEDALGLLRQLVPEAQLRRALRRARWKRSYDNWMELIHSLGSVNAAFWLSVIYLTLGWIAAPSCRRRLRPAGGSDAGPAS
jgi:rubrerythrin